MDALDRERTTKASLTNVITAVAVAKGISSALVVTPAHNRRFCSIRAGANNRPDLLFTRCENAESWLSAVIGCCNGCPGSFIMHGRALPLIPNARNFICMSRGFEWGSFKQLVGKVKDKSCSTCYAQEFVAQSDDGVLFDSIKFTTAALNVEVEDYSYEDQNI